MGREVVLHSTDTQVQRNLVKNLVQAISTSGVALASEEFPVTHHFAPMQYAREMLIRAGLLVVGRVHNKACINVISAGACTVYTVGEGESYIEAPCTFVSQADTQRVIVAHTDTVWTTVHITDKTDPDEILRELTRED